jgi:organic hydroperoxide reductase OsmC/OhrA
MSNEQVKTFSVSINHVERFKFLVDFEQYGELTTDEPEPLGNGEGPNPARLLIASIGNCLCASLLFAIEKHAKKEVAISANITGEISRVDKYWRVTNVKVNLAVNESSHRIEHFDKILAQFENFCIVTQSVRQGIPVEVSITDSEGTIIHLKD